MNDVKPSGYPGEVEGYDDGFIMEYGRDVPKKKKEEPHEVEHVDFGWAGEITK